MRSIRCNQFTLFTHTEKRWNWCIGISTCLRNYAFERLVYLRVPAIRWCWSINLWTCMQSPFIHIRKCSFGVLFCLFGLWMRARACLRVFWSASPSDIRACNANRISFDGSNASLSHVGGATRQLFGAQNIAAHNTTVREMVLVLCAIHWQEFRVIWRRCVNFYFPRRNNQQFRISENSENHFLMSLHI